MRTQLIISYPFLFIFAWVNSYINTHFVSSQCLENKKSLLLELRTSLEFNHSLSTKLVMWNQSKDCCQWSGVQCDSANGQVIGLDLSNETISSGIDNFSSLFCLRSLQSLNLASNYLSMEIPSALSKLSGLSYLNLSYTGFFGQVPIEISHLVKLVTLDISFTYVFMENPNFSAVIRNLTNIRELYVDGIAISAKGKEWCEVISSSLPQLQVLSMSNCNLTGEIHESLAKLHALSVIRLDVNNFSSPVPQFLARFKNLTTLSLSSCGLIGTVPPEIFQVPTLTTLDLSYNDMLHGTLPDFHQNMSLQTLILKSSNFSGILPNTISNLKMLNTIDLFSCDFHGNIPSAVASLNLLEYVDLSSNKFTGPIPSFSSMKDLRNLLLRDNGLTGSITSTDWGGLLNLARVDLSDNSLTGSIPMSMFSMPTLQELTLARNTFNGQLNEIARIPLILSHLDLSSNHLEGPIPKSMSQIKGLTHLDLSRNGFHGTLELNEILHWFQNLLYLDLSHNRLSINTNGTSTNFPFPQLNFLYLASCNLHSVPEFLKNQSYLASLDLSNNQIQGIVPSWIWKVGESIPHHSINQNLNLSYNKFVDLDRSFPHVVSFDILDLHSNNLQGELPAMPLQSGLLYLDYSNNSFTSISPDIGKSLSVAKFLSLSRNKIYGNIPTSLCNATQLEVLDLGYNHLHGRIPDCLIVMARSLGVLNLKGNDLSGSIPDKFGKSCISETLDFNGNFLQGKIPTSLANCIKLKVLNLGNNLLKDTFPCKLKSLSDLQVLILRSNTFLGTLACLESYSIWPVLQIIDLASNHFTGELTAHMFLKWKSMMAKTNHTQSEPSILQYFQPMVNVYYQNRVVLTFKGYQLELPNILTTRTSIDFSNNDFHGELPKELGNLSDLKYLNLSHNFFSGYIPTSIRNLGQLESLDLSYNSLNGYIPQQLASLTFLSSLNLSFNKLAGQIPTGTQLQSFSASSYMGNQGLCGPPLALSCRSTNVPESVNLMSPDGAHRTNKSELDWAVVGVEVGIPVGIAVTIGPLLCIRRWKRWYNKYVDRLVMKILNMEEQGRGRTRSTRSRTQQRQRRKPQAVMS